MQSSSPSSSRSDPIARAVLIALLCSFPALSCFRRAGNCVIDPDVGWHLRVGQWIVQHHAVPHADSFSRLGGTPWQAYSWLFELVLLMFYQVLHLQGLVVFTAVMMTLIAMAVYHMMSRLQADFSQRALLVTAVMFSLCTMSTPRPWLFTILFFTIEIDILMQTRQSGKSRELLWLPPLFLLWANLHIQFIYGFLVLVIAACEPLLARWWKPAARPVRARRLWMILAACVGVSIVNPFGAGIYKIIYELGANSGVLNSVTEMQAMSFRTAGDFLVLFLALAAAGVLFRYRQLAPFETLMLVIAAVLSFRCSRDSWVVTIVAGAILAAGIPVRAERKVQGSLPTWALAMSVLVAVAMFTGSLALLRVNNARLRTLQAATMPVQAVSVIRARHYTGALFNDYNWGGFLIWNLQQPVSIDGRSSIYGEARIDRTEATWAGGPQWASDPDLASAELVIAPEGAALTQLLRTDRRFALTYEDKVAAVFVARGNQKNEDVGLTALNHATNGSDAERRLP